MADDFDIVYRDALTKQGVQSRLQRREWQEAVTLPLLQLVTFFESQPFDWLIKKVTVADNIQLEYLDEGSYNNLKAKRIALSFKDDTISSANDDYALSFWLTCESCKPFCGRKLRGIILQRNLAEVQIFESLPVHDTIPDPACLQPSARLKNKCSVMALERGRTASDFLRVIADMRANSPHFFHHFSSERRFLSQRQVENLFQRHRQKRDGTADNLFAIQQQYESDPSPFLHYETYAPPQELVIVLAHQYCMEWLVQNGEVVYIDTSYRNKTNSCAAVSNLVVSEHLSGRLFPVSAMVSSRASTVEYKKFLEATKRGAQQIQAGWEP